MFARTARYEVPLDRMEADIRQANELQHEIAAMPGIKGFYYLADRATGHTMSVTFWEDEDALKASETQAVNLRQRLTQATGATMVSVEEFEVVAVEAEMVSAS